VNPVNLGLMLENVASSLDSRSNFPRVVSYFRIYSPANIWCRIESGIEFENEYGTGSLMFPSRISMAFEA
jgi:hypothetical protein